jgi:hypothetical protein
MLALWKKKKRDQNNEKKQTPSNTMLNACIHVFITKRRKTQKVEERKAKAEFNSRQRIAGRGDQAS